MYYEYWLLVMSICWQCILKTSINIRKYQYTIFHNQMPKPQRKQSLMSQSPNSHSALSDISRALYREQALARRLRHIQEQNTRLEEQIVGQQQEIKDQRTVIIYQMGELTRSVANKVGQYQEHRLGGDKFEGQAQAQETLRELMARYEAVEKEEKMMDKVRGNMEKMFEVYTEHKEAINNLLAECSVTHRDNQQRMRLLIGDKRKQLRKIQEQNTFMQQQMQRMKQQMASFKQQQQTLSQSQQNIRKQIKDKQQKIQEQHKYYEQCSKWTEIVVDKRKRHELMEGIQRKRRELAEVQNARAGLEMGLREGGDRKK